MSEAVPVLRLTGIERRFKEAEGELHVLRGADLTLYAGETMALIGPSGSGKSTLLHIAGLLERPSTGTVEIEGTDMTSAGDDKRTAMRRRTLGFVYQFHHLLPEFSAVENVAMPMLTAGEAGKEATSRATHLLQAVGLGERLSHRPAELSGGEQQRVAIARALANRPRLLLADEPTGNLDTATGERVFSLLLDLAAVEGVAMLIATHDPNLARRLGRCVKMDDGRLASVD